MRVFTSILHDICVCGLVCGVTLNAGNLLFASDQPKLDEIRNASLNQVKLIRSIELTMLFESRIHVANAAFGKHLKKLKKVPNDIVQKGRVIFVQEGDKYMIDSEITDTITGKKTTEVAAYNGDRYQLLDKEKKALGFSTKLVSLNPSRCLNPLIMPYVWLLNEDTDKVFSEIKNAKFWNDRFATASYLGKRKENGMIVDVVEFPWPFKEDLPKNMQDAVVHVYFAEDLGYYPIAQIVQSNAGHIIGETRITSYKEFNIDGQKVVIPLKESSNYKIRDVITANSTSTVLPETIKINHPIEDKLFTIPHALATRVEDVDKNLEAHNRLVE